MVKIEKPNERSKKSESKVAHWGTTGQMHIHLLQAVGFLTGEMKESRNWLKGRQMPREEVAGPGLGDSLLAWTEEAAPLLTHSEGSHSGGAQL